MEAFRTDCQTLITRFELSYNTHFQNFCEIWKEMQFGLIFAYHPSEAALTTFCEDALCIIKQFLVNASSLKERIGALYLTYGVYYKMPVKQLKIRMTLSDWSCLMELHSQIKQEEYHDANYILCKMIVDHIFIHCISDREFTSSHQRRTNIIQCSMIKDDNKKLLIKKLLRVMTLTTYVKVIGVVSFKYGIERHFYEKQEQPKLDVNLMPEIKELAAPEKLLSTISKLSKVYEEKKRALYDAEGDSSLQLYDASIADNIVDDIRTIQSESRIFVKSSDVKNTNSNKPSTAAAAAAETVQKGQKRIRVRKNQVLSKIGRAFEKGLQSEEESETEREDTKTFLNSHLEVNDSDGTVNGHVHSYPVVQPQRYSTMRSGDDTSDVSVMFSPVLRVNGSFFGRIIRSTDRLSCLPPNRCRSRIRSCST
ncbi:snRNA-activating protein complex subunit 1 [Atta colombica]|uniref:snRNA-activating protein complex subunit 1 n=1 Tax=Atta colombica TaxID=520822 RepID=A0A151HZ78_9HYME|nr:snRNA-activating protein complex subunit 1 [Atta colombica]